MFKQRWSEAIRGAWAKGKCTAVFPPPRLRTLHSAGEGRETAKSAKADFERMMSSLFETTPSAAAESGLSGADYGTVFRDSVAGAAGDPLREGEKKEREESHLLRRQRLSKTEATQFIDLLSQRVLQAAYVREREDPVLRQLEDALEKKAVFFSKFEKERRNASVRAKRNGGRRVYGSEERVELDKLREEILSLEDAYDVLRWANERVFGFGSSGGVFPWLVRSRGGVHPFNSNWRESRAGGLIHSKLYEPVVLLLFRVLRDKMAAPQLALRMADLVEHGLGAESRLNGCSTALYNDVLATHWDTYMDVSACRDVVRDMQAGGVVFNGETRAVIERMGAEIVRDAKQGFLFGPEDVAAFREMEDTLQSYWRAEGWHFGLSSAASAAVSHSPSSKRFGGKYSRQNTHNRHGGRARKTDSSRPTYNIKLPNAQIGSNPVLQRFVAERTNRSLSEIRDTKGE